MSIFIAGRRSRLLSGATLSAIVLAMQAALGGQLAAGAEEHLAAHGPGVAWPLHLLQHLAHDLLALAAGVDLGVVEEVDAVVIGDHHELFGGGVADLLAEGEPAAQAQFTDLEAAISEVTVAHGWGER